MTLSVRGRLALFTAYAALLLYGTWFPIDRWDWSLGGWEAFMNLEWPARIPSSDLVINLIVYVPLGLTVAMLFRRGPLISAILAAAIGFFLSSGLELGQTYLPGRVTSGTDIALNTFGASIGALASGFLTRSRWIHRHYRRIESGLRHPGPGHLGLLVLALWLLSQWAPWVPSLDFGYIKQGLAPFKALLGAPPAYISLRFVNYLAMLLGLMALALRLFRDRELAARWLVLCLFVVLFGKVLIMTRQLSPEALLAALFTTMITLRLRRSNSSSLQLIALASLIIYHALSTFLPEANDPTLRRINWIPFRGQMNSITGIIDLVGSLWLYAAYAYLMFPKRRRSIDGLAMRLVLVAPWAIFLEWGQQSVPGRYPDITDVVVGIATFVIAYSSPWRRLASGKSETLTKSSSTETRPWRRAAGATAVALGLLIAIGQFSDPETRSVYALPKADELPNPRLTNFRYKHPRLPAPVPDDWRKLERENPVYVKRRRADAGARQWHARILLARTEPDTVDMDALFNELMALEFVWRGHEQTIPIALAYDWLYDRWTPSQRSRLLAKTEQACAYQITAIRDKYELSPYNVYLYNSPLQALMMAALAIYGDSTGGNCMRFTYDYWKHRVLPVWSQIMGRQGGWHEGGEYVGIGIGQAVHRLPAMWRRATGEDLFAKHAGIRGFPNFALQRKRPDGTIARLGDIAFVTKGIADLAPLALELRHSAAYTASSPPEKPTPLGFPWGPFSDNTLLDPGAWARQPLQRWFDGIGLLIARSDWSSDATYITVRAGNNYWSHSHLDQGAFTLFKGGALAIDSGVYFDYGGEHHLNYAYQSVAHNVVTVTDPEDTALLPGKEKTLDNGERQMTPDRPIANDGGQRRVGSGWGKPAPLDLADWQAQAGDYRTVGQVLVDVDPRDALVWINADLTPAYTNEESDRGEFFARTRRVERYLRTVVYLRDMDLLLVHDRLRFSKSSLRSRWLLHSQNAIDIAGKRFALSAGNGELQGEVLLPENATLQGIGGPGLQFFVDNLNYDQQGKAQEWAAKREGIEAGTWRLEVQPNEGSRELNFLVALRPSLKGSPAGLPSIVISDGDNKSITLEIDGGRRLLRLPKLMEAVSSPRQDKK